MATNQLTDEERAKAQGITARFLYHYSDPGRLAKVVEELAAGNLHVVVAQKFSLANVEDAFKRQGAGAHGKFIMRVG